MKVKDVMTTKVVICLAGQQRQKRAARSCWTSM